MMKGVIFCEFLAWVEEWSGVEGAQSLVEMCALESEGAYTAVGTYPVEELVALVVSEAGRRECEVGEVLRGFGEWLFSRLASRYGSIMAPFGGVFEVLRGLDEVIHVEVRKLYSDAELPRFRVERSDVRELDIVYQSARPLADVAEGLIAGCIAHYGERIGVEREDLDGAPGTHARFMLRVEESGA